jgi:hypothetical protein
MAFENVFRRWNASRRRRRGERLYTLWNGIPMPLPEPDPLPEITTATKPTFIDYLGMSVGVLIVVVATIVMR